MKIVKTVLKVVFAAIFVLSGCVHFFDPGFYLKIMPDYIASSLHLPAVYVSGAAEIMLGILLLIPRTTRLAGWGLIALLIAVFPANISAYQHSREIFPDLDPALHFWRLPLQGTIIAWAYQYTRPKRPTVQQSKEAVG
ncbi:MAG: DoxX family protein [Planctomycetia bacterium]|nr:DoxX family protein [Planctomycetia bacterium]